VSSLSGLLGEVDGDIFRVGAGEGSELGDDSAWRFLGARFGDVNGICWERFGCIGFELISGICGKLEVVLGLMIEGSFVGMGI